MTDIAERLRNLSLEPSELRDRIGSEAANEIEMLRNLVENQLTLEKASTRIAIAKLAAANAEIERLQATIDLIRAKVKSELDDHGYPGATECALYAIRCALEGEV